MSAVPAVAEPTGAVWLDFLKKWARIGGTKIFNFVAGLAILVALWWLGVWYITLDPALEHFRSFAPNRAIFEGIPAMWEFGGIQRGLGASGYRLGMGMLIAIAIGVPLGILVGRSELFGDMTHLPFQLLRMVSPLSWEPIAVIAFATWDRAIIFLIVMGAVWPVMFATAAGIAKIDPAWFKVARNLGAKRLHVLTQVILPAVTYDVLTGIRLAVGVAWIVLIPAEFFGTRAGIGYTIEDARENLFYDQMMGMIVLIGVIGYILDTILVQLLNRANWVRET
ncbi:MAG: ABC transporter permease [Betaproteobacteria bacterium]|nr:ABC transporter permease [Betaproteobacteria bacterium]